MEEIVPLCREITRQANGVVTQYHAITSSTQITLNIEAVMSTETSATNYHFTRRQVLEAFHFMSKCFIAPCCRLTERYRGFRETYRLYPSEVRQRWRRYVPVVLTTTLHHRVTTHIPVISLTSAVHLKLGHIPFVFHPACIIMRLFNSPIKQRTSSPNKLN